MDSKEGKDNVPVGIMYVEECHRAVCLDLSISRFMSMINLNVFHVGSECMQMTLNIFQE